MYTAVVIFLAGLSCLAPPLAESTYTVEKIADGFRFTEGPVWVPGEGLLFSDIPAGKVYLYTVDGSTETYIEESGHSNGLALNSSGQLLLAQHGLRQVARFENRFIPLASSYRGEKLNSPNDLVVHSGGSIYFTDPPFGLMDLGLKSDLGFSGIYRISPEGELHLLDNELELPNGLTFSPDESILYVDDSRERIIYSYQVEDDLSLGERQEFARIPVSGYADGMKTDKDGNLYVTGPDGVWVFTPDGETLDHISIPGQTSASNCAWGDDDGESLYVTSNNAVYRIRKKTSE